LPDGSEFLEFRGSEFSELAGYIERNASPCLLQIDACFRWNLFSYGIREKSVGTLD